MAQTYENTEVGTVLDLPCLFPSIPGTETRLTIDLKDDNGVAGNLTCMGLLVSRVYAIRFKDDQPLMWEVEDVA